MGALAGLAPILGAIGTGIQVLGTIQAGREAKARYAYEAKVQRQQADEAEAASQRDAQQRYREGQMILSQQRAAIAGSGGDLTDPSVIDLMDDTKDQVIYAADSDIYKGKQQAAGFNDAAKISKINGDNAMKAAWLNAGANLFAGVSNMYSRFGQQAQRTSTASGSTAPLYG